jgi:hypothetical protein
MENLMESKSHYKVGTIKSPLWHPKKRYLLPNKITIGIPLNGMMHACISCIFSKVIQGMLSSE